MPEVQTARWGWGVVWKMVWGPQTVVARLGRSAVMIRGGSWQGCRSRSARAARLVQMRCRECAAEVASDGSGVRAVSATAVSSTSASLRFTATAALRERCSCYLDLLTAADFPCTQRNRCIGARWQLLAENDPGCHPIATVEQVALYCVGELALAGDRAMMRPGPAGRGQGASCCRACISRRWPPGRGGP
jgi:hypothetical protein